MYCLWTKSTSIVCWTSDRSNTPYYWQKLHLRGIEECNLSRNCFHAYHLISIERLGDFKNSLRICLDWLLSQKVVRSVKFQVWATPDREDSLDWEPRWLRSRGHLLPLYVYINFSRVRLNQAWKYKTNTVEQHKGVECHMKPKRPP